MKDLTGQMFNYWTVLNPTIYGKGQLKAWFCQCKCGNYSVVTHNNLFYGKSKSCGCWMKEYNSKLFTTHGMSKTPEYKTWKAIKDRCHNPKSEPFSDYGGRGITVCDEWLDSFEQFFKDMGLRPKGMTLERTDNDKGYSKENCKWATRKEQCNNRRSCHLVTYNLKTQTMTRWAEELGIKVGTLWRRLKENRPIESPDKK